MNPPDELVDIVDASDAVIGQATKAEAHEKGLLHRTVIAEVKDSRGSFLLVKQSGSRQDAGQWVSPVGGHVRAGESTDGAMKREAGEELGISDFQFAFVGKAVFNRDVIGRHENHFYIVYEILTDKDPVLNHESVEFRRFTADELKESARHSPGMFGAAWYFVAKNFYPDLLTGQTKNF